MNIFQNCNDFLSFLFCLNSKHNVHRIQSCQTQKRAELLHLNLAEGPTDHIRAGVLSLHLTEAVGSSAQYTSPRAQNSCTVGCRFLQISHSWYRWCAHCQTWFKFLQTFWLDLDTLPGPEPLAPLLLEPSLPASALLHLPCSSCPQPLVPLRKWLKPKQCNQVVQLLELMMKIRREWKKSMKVIIHSWKYEVGTN